MESLIKQLHEGSSKLLVRNNGSTYSFASRGIKDIYNMYMNDCNKLKGADVADIIIGKAAAAIMIAGGVKRVYAEVISKPALNLFEKNHVGISYKLCVPNIIRRDKQGICPMEQLTLDATTINEAVERIKNKLEQTE